LQKEDWHVQRFQGFTNNKQTDKELKEQEEINRLRRQVANALGQFDKDIRQAKTVRKKCEILFKLFESFNIPSKLEYTRYLYVEIAGEEQINQKMFKSVLESGLESLEYSHVPPNLDHIIIATIDHSRITNKKCAFLLGVNEGMWPKTPPADGMISEQERETLK